MIRFPNWCIPRFSDWSVDRFVMLGSYPISFHQIYLTAYNSVSTASVLVSSLRIIIMYSIMLKIDIECATDFLVRMR